jgi:hypothetical protein
LAAKLGHWLLVKLKPIFLTIAVTGVVVLALFTAGTSWRIWDKPEHAARECSAVAAIANEIASSKGLENGFEELRVSFWPALDGSPAYMTAGEPPAFRYLVWRELPWWPESALSVALAHPSTLDCGDELSTSPTVTIESDFRAPRELGVSFQQVVHPVLAGRS